MADAADTRGFTLQHSRILEESGNVVRPEPQLDVLVRDGWFVDESEIVRTALWEFVRRNQFALTEHYQREDIAWALQHHRIRATGKSSA